MNLSSSIVDKFNFNYTLLDQAKHSFMISFAHRI